MWCFTYTFFLTVAVRKDYIHGALFFYSDCSVGIIVWTRFQAKLYLWLHKTPAFGHRALWCFLQPDAT